MGLASENGPPDKGRPDSVEGERRQGINWERPRDMPNLERVARYIDGRGDSRMDGG